MKNILVYHDSANPWYAALMRRGFTRFARSHRWRLVFVPRTAAAREPRRLRRLVAEFRPAGLFANYTEGLRDLAPRLLPTVWFDCATWKIVPRTRGSSGVLGITVSASRLVKVNFAGQPSMRPLIVLAETGLLLILCLSWSSARCRISLLQ